MKRLRGFKIGQRFVTIFKCMAFTKRIQTGKRQSLTRIFNPVTKICSLARRFLLRGANRLCSGKKSDQSRLGIEPKTPAVPKGHLVVHVGESGIDTQRVVIPVIYFNHPLFGELLEQAERVYGFNQPGRITIPCRLSDFEKVHIRIAAWDHSRKKRTFKIL